MVAVMIWFFSVYDGVAVYGQHSYFCWWCIILLASSWVWLSLL